MSIPSKNFQRTRPGTPLALLSAIALALALSACGREEPQAPATDTPAPEAAPESSPSTPPPAPVPAPAPEPAPQPAPAPSSDSSSAVPGASSISGLADSTRQAAGQAADSAAGALDDTGITAKVKAELIQDSELSALDVNVQTSGGQVTLAGTAPSAQAKERAESLAKGVQGVTGVTNNLEVKAGS